VDLQPAAIQADEMAEVWDAIFDLGTAGDESVAFLKGTALQGKLS
jgi:hypothetical protein